MELNRYIRHTFTENRQIIFLKIEVFIGLLFQPIVANNLNRPIISGQYRLTILLGLLNISYNSARLFS
jgi:hypothetical protein